MIALALALMALPVTAARAADDETRIIVGRDPGLSGAERADIRRDAGVTLDQTLRVPDAEVVTAPAGEAHAALRELRRDPDVQWAQVDHRRSLTALDTLFPQQWALATTAGIDASDAWATGAEGAGVTVAVVDTGVDLTHPDLAGHFSAPATWKDWVQDDATPQDEHGHGTHVAGIVAATRDNGMGIAGVAPKSTIMPLRVLDADGSGWDSDIADAFAWAGDHGARIVNASLGGPDPAPVIAAAIAAHPGTLYVVAAGNDGQDNDVTPDYPCSLPASNVLCVGATDGSGGRAGFSNYGRQSVDLFAPGDLIYSTWIGDLYAKASGTSMAAPQVAGVAALIEGKLTGTPPSGATLGAALRAAVDPVASLAGLSVTGGRIDALRAVTGEAPAATTTSQPVTSTPPPSPPPAPPAPPAAPAPAPPAPAPATPARAKRPADRDHDGRADASDACPRHAARTRNGCPKPRVRRFKLSVARHRRLTARVRADRRARITLRIERRSCRRSRHHHHKRCSWRRVKTKHATARRTSLVRHVRHGRYRVTVRLSSRAGRGGHRRRTIRVR